MKRFRRGKISASLCAALLLTASTAAAESAPPRAVPNSNVPEGFHVTRVILLGTGGGPTLRSDRLQISTVLLVDGRPYMIDVGAGVVPRLVAAGIDTRFIQRVFITHNHTDHYNGILEFQSSVWTDRSQRNLVDPPVQIFGPNRTKSIVENSLKAFSVSEQIFGSLDTQSRPASSMFTTTEVARDGIVYSDDLVTVTAVRNTHFDNFPRDSVAILAGDESYSYRFDTPAGSVVFSGDTGCSEALEKLAEGADLLVSEVRKGSEPGGPPGGTFGATPGARPGAAPGRNPTPFETGGVPPRWNPNQGAASAAARPRGCWGHLSSEEVGQIASRAQVGAVLLNHFVPGLDDEKDMSLYTVGALKHYTGPVIAGRDLFEYTLVKPASR